jgi:hypothetical protein
MVTDPLSVLVRGLEVVLDDAGVGTPVSGLDVVCAVVGSVPLRGTMVVIATDC